MQTLQGRSLRLLSCAPAPQKPINNHAKLPANSRLQGTQSRSLNNTSRASHSVEHNGTDTQSVNSQENERHRNLSQEPSSAGTGTQSNSAHPALTSATGLTHKDSVLHHASGCKLLRTSYFQRPHNSHKCNLKDFVFLSLSEIFSCLSDKTFLIRRCQ